MIVQSLILNKPAVGNKTPLELLTAQLAQNMYGEGKLTDKFSTTKNLYNFFSAVGNKAISQNSVENPINANVKKIFLDDSGQLTQFAEYLIEGLIVRKSDVKKYFVDALQGKQSTINWEMYDCVIEHQGSLTMMNQLDKLMTLIASPTTNVQKIKDVVSTMKGLVWANCLNGSSNIINSLYNQLAPTQMLANAAKALIYNLSKNPALLAQVGQIEHIHIPSSIARSLGMPADIIDTFDTYVALSNLPHIRFSIASQGEQIIAGVFVSLIQQFNQLYVDLEAVQPLIEKWQNNQKMINLEDVSTINQQAEHALLTHQLAQKINAIAGEHGNLLAKYINNNDLVEIEPARLKFSFTENAAMQYSALQSLAQKQHIQLPTLVQPLDLREQFKQSYLAKFKEQPELQTQFLELWQNANENLSLEALKEFLKEHIWQIDAQAFAKDDLDFNQDNFLKQKYTLLKHTLEQKSAPASTYINLPVDEVQAFQADAQKILVNDNTSNITWPEQGFSKLICDYDLDGSPQRIHFDALLNGVAKTIIEEFKTYDVSLEEPILLTDLTQLKEHATTEQNAINQQNIASTSKSPIQYNQLNVNNMAKAQVLGKLTPSKTKLLHQLITLKANDKQKLLTQLKQSNSWQHVEKTIDVFASKKLASNKQLQKIIELLKKHKAYSATYNQLIERFYPKFLQIIKSSDLYSSDVFKTNFADFYKKQGLHKTIPSNKTFESRLLYAVINIFLQDIQPVYYERLENDKKTLIEEKPSFETILNIITHCQDINTASQAIKNTQIYVTAQCQPIFFKLLAGEYGLQASILARKLLVEKTQQKAKQGCISNEILQDFFKEILTIDTQTSFQTELNDFLHQIDEYTPNLVFAKPEQTINTYQTDPLSHKISDIHAPAQLAIHRLQQPTQVSDFTVYLQKLQQLSSKRGTPGAAILAKAKVKALDDLLAPLQNKGTQKLFRGINTQINHLKVRSGTTMQVGEVFQFPNETYTTQYSNKAKDYVGDTLMLIFAQKSAPMHIDEGENKSWRTLISPSQNFKPLIIFDTSEYTKVTRKQIVVMEEVDENGKPFSAAQGRQGYFEALTDDLPDMNLANKQLSQPDNLSDFNNADGAIWNQLNFKSLSLVYKPNLKAKEI